MNYGPKKLKELFRKDAAFHDNYLFKLHHQANFAVVLVGIVFVTGMNYFNGNAIECVGATDFQKQYCWLHGSGHIPDNLKSDKVKCTTDQNTNETHTSYYLWIPFVLGLCLAVIKAPRVLWKEVCERGVISGAVGGKDEQPADKIVERFRKLRLRANRFHLAFFVCELLNIASVFICFFILNSLLGGKFFSYGYNFSNFNPADADEVNPMCNLFPTLVSCNVIAGGITGEADRSNILCLLSNNLFNQYYFLILWFWWVVLLVISGLGLVYRLTQFLSRDFSKTVFTFKMEPYGQDDNARELKSLTIAEFFLLGRICQNLKGSKIESILKELREQEPRMELRLQPIEEKDAMISLEMQD